jgi:N-acetylglucosaminyldiphosphoundecaprenol N-acetyl-beta-D-mannosaminyltransferase
VFTDGVPVAWVGKRAYPGLASSWDRVYGPDVMEAVLDASGPDGPRHYLLGGSPEMLAVLRSVVAERWPSAVVVGAESPPFRALSAEEVAAQDSRIRDSGATIVWVGLGTPKQDWEVARLAGSVPVVAMAVGAAFDFLAGVKPQAPVWMQRSGTEWAFRFASEPRRLAKRYLWGNPRFLVAAAREPGLRKGGRRCP